MGGVRTVPVGAFQGSKLVRVYASVKDAAASLRLAPLAMQNLLNRAEPHSDGRVYVRMKRASDDDDDPLVTLAAAGEALEAAVPDTRMALLAYLIRQRNQIIRQASRVHCPAQVV